MNKYASTFSTLKELEDYFPTLAQIARETIDTLGVGEYMVFSSPEAYINWIFERELPELGAVHDRTIPDKNGLPNPLWFMDTRAYFDELVKGWEDSGMIVDEDNGHVCYPISTLVSY